jgi:zinc carboxypeptidase
MKASLCWLAISVSLLAQGRVDKFEYWPGASYDPSVPTEQQVIGHDPGNRVTRPEDIVKYMEALAAARPHQMRVFDYGKTWEGRRLIYCAVSSEANIRRLDEIRGGMKQLADPRKISDADAKRIMARMPAVLWLAYGVHGNEISSNDAAMLTAYHLVASRNDKLVDEILANVLVILDPAQNPDGRARFVHNFEIAEGLKADPSQLAAEHNEPWPGGRTNHYYFDLNRDWFAMSQPETQGRIKAVLDWFPLAYVDLHEMGSNGTYYFAPEANPFNPYITRTQRDSLEWFGKNNAKWFDRYGFSYFTREAYDEFYPGYGASWPLFHGSIGMTYEQASTRGLEVRRSDGKIVQYRDTVRDHFVASISSSETALRNKDRLLDNFYQYRKAAAADGATDAVREYILPHEGNISNVDKLAASLAFQGVEVKRATSTFQNAGKEYPAGTYVISMAQPARRLARTLLDAQVSMESDFLKGEEHRRENRQPSEMYDVTAWSLPMQYCVSAVSSGDVSKGSFEAVKPGELPPGKVIGAKPDVAYLVPWGVSAAARFLTAGLQEDLKILTTDKVFKLAGRTYPAGSLILKVKDNAPDLAEKVERIAKSSGAEVYATDTGWVDEGVNFGSSRVFGVPRAVVALAWDRPTAPASAGAARFILERQYGYPVSAVRTDQLAGDLSQFQVIILPDTGGGGPLGGGSYDTVLGANGARRLNDWVQAGGTLIGLGGAVAYLADPRTGLLAISQENVVRESAPSSTGGGRGGAATAPGGGPTGGAPTAAQTPSQAPAAPTVRVPGKLLTSDQDFDKAIQPDSELPDSLHGVLVRAKVNPEQWVTAGLPDTIYVLASGRAIFTPIKLDKGFNAVYFAGPDQLLASGFMWEPNRKQMAYKPFVVVQPSGRGNVIGFTEDPNFRGYMDGLNLLFLNAVFRGAAHGR